MSLLSVPLTWTTLTLLVYWLAISLYQKKPKPYFNPVFLSVAILIGCLLVSSTPFEVFKLGSDPISFFLAPAVVALGVVVHERIQTIKKRLTGVLIAVFVGSLSGIISVVLVALFMGASPELLATLAPKSVTTPIAISIAEKTGGIASLSAAIVIAVGIFGAMFGPIILYTFGIRNKVAFGLAIGTASHGIGTARALEEGEIQGALGGLAMGINGVFTAILVPFLLQYKELEALRNWVWGLLNS